MQLWKKGVYRVGENRLNRLRLPNISNTARMVCTAKGAKGTESALGRAQESPDRAVSEDSIYM